MGRVELESLLILIFSLLITGLHFVDKWFLYKGKIIIVYWLGIAASSLGICLNVILAMKDDQLRPLTLFIFNAIWSIIMCTKGLIRTKEN